jgi:MFS family permease
VPPSAPTTTLSAAPPLDVAPPAAGRKWAQLLLLALVGALGMSLWFSMSAVVPQLAAEWGLTAGEQAAITLAVQIGFVAGALASAIANLSDRTSPRWLLAGSALVAAAANGALVALDGDVPAAVALRFVTGFALAGVYPPAMKLVATWCREDRGLGIGVLVGALSFGKALPHLLNALPALGAGGMPPWRGVVLATTAQAALGGLLALAAVRRGPYLAASAPFDWRFAGRALADRPTRLVNFGYLGHMWELYAVWTWAPLLLLASYEAAGLSPAAARVAGFATLAIGAPGAVLAGRLADRLGRSRITIWSLAVSGACSLVAGFFFGSPVALTVLCLVWGFAVVADSAQFSAAVSELADPRYVGSALTLQTCLGFLLTLVTIGLVPAAMERLGWRWAFPLLAIGPAFGIWSMATLARLPAARRMAGGRG